MTNAKHKTQNAKLPRLLLYCALALLEATPPSLVLLLFGLPGALPVLMLLGLIAALFELALVQRIANNRQRPLRVALAALLAFGAAMLLAGGLDALAATFAWTHNNALGIYVALLAGLYMAWRGSLLTLSVDDDPRDMFGRVMLSVLAVLLAAVLTGSISSSFIGTLLTGELLLAFGVGLILVALSRQQQQGAAQTTAGWYRLAPVLAAITLVIVLSLAILGLLGPDAAELLQRIITSILFAFFVLISPLLDFILSGMIGLFERLGLPQALAMLQNLAVGLAKQTELPEQTELDLEQQYPWLGILMRTLKLGLPIALLLALIWYMARRRRARSSQSTDIRESLFSWGGLADDLLGLLGRFGKQRDDDSLEAALARLKGHTAALRIRRSYLRMLIAAQQRQRPRPATVTPREYQPAASGVFLGAEAALSKLTVSYERARYHGESVTEDEADDIELLRFE